MQSSLPHVTCHMMVSIDGKIDGDFIESPANAHIARYYDDELFKLGTAWGNGSTTHKMYFSDDSVDLSRYRGQAVLREDKTFEATGPFCVTFDTHGIVFWPQNTNEYPEGVHNRVIEVVTQSVSDEFIAYLDDKKIPRIFAGTDSIDLSLALSKLKVLFGVQQFVITGGAKINGAFFQAGLVDAISLVIAPSIDGSKEHKTIAELMTQSSTSWKLKASTAVDAGLHLIWQKVC